MRSVGSPELESEPTEVAPPAAHVREDHRVAIPLIGIALVGVLLWLALNALDSSPGTTSVEPSPTTTTAPTQTPSTGTAAAAPEALATSPTTVDVSPRPEVEGARVLREAVPEWPVNATETGFVKIGTQGGERIALISPNGLWWDSNLAVPMKGIDFDYPIAAISSSPNWDHTVAIWRSERGFLVSRSTNNGDWLAPVRIDASPTSAITDFVVGSKRAFVAIDGGATDPYGASGPAYAIALEGDLDVRALAPFPSLPDLVSVDAGTRLGDGSVAARGTTADGEQYLLHLLPDGDVAVGQFDTDGFERARLFALGTTLVIVEDTGKASLLRFDKAPTAAFDYRLERDRTASNGQVLISIRHDPRQTTLLAWKGESAEPSEIPLGADVEIDEIVAFNTNEALLATITADGQRWLVNVPIP